MMQCQALTKKGVNCRRKPKENGFCTQHRDYTPYIPGDPAITITFGDVAESYIGMEQIGEKAESGLNLADLRAIQKEFTKTELHELHFGYTTETEAFLLIARNGLDDLLEENNLLDELLGLDWDTKALSRYGGVRNKKARYNLCFDDESSEPDYEEGKGRIVAFDDTSIGELREKLGCIHQKFIELKAEGNLYYDSNDCGIGYHGDQERKIVIGLRLGESIPLTYRWYQNSKVIGETMSFTLNHGDIYFMSEKAVGNDVRKRKIPTLRHAAGCRKYTT